MRKSILLSGILLLLINCAPGKKSNIIGVYYKKINEFNEKEIIKNFNKTVFNINHSIMFKRYSLKPNFSVIKEFNKNRVKIIILEDHNRNNIQKIYHYCRKKDIILSLISDQKCSSANIINYTDFQVLGYNIANQLYNYTRRKRQVFTIMMSSDYSNNYRKNELINGYHEFIASRPNLICTTNIYTTTNQQDLKTIIYSLKSRYSNNLRGLLADNDEIAVKIAHILRKTGLENEIKISGFNATLKGLDSIMKTGLVVTGDIDRYALFEIALLTGINKYKVLVNNTLLTNSHPGVYYNQYNTLEQLSLTKKYSLKQILH